MKEKELRKLSRLEVLELLLEQTKEKEKLSEELEQLKATQNNSLQTQTLKELVDRMNEALKNIQSFQTNTNSAQKHSIPPEGKNESPTAVSDKNIYCRLLGFYYKNPDALNSLPLNLQKDIDARIKGLINEK